LNPLFWKLYVFSIKLNFIHILVPRFRRGKSCQKIANEKKRG
jgi:hypothetical protein